jgi:hypothetical protein
MSAGHPSPASPTDVVKPPPWRPAAAVRPALALATLAGVWLALLGGCAGSGAAASSKGGRELVMSYDDSRATGTVAFPSQTYESVTRFELPPGEHRALRLRLLAAAPGGLSITVYDSTPLETPGEPLVSITRDLQASDLSDGKDGRWVVEELAELKPLKGVVWVGLRKASGDPRVWSSGVVSGQAYVRNSDPQNLIGLLPVKRTPMVRLELAP